MGLNGIIGKRMVVWALRRHRWIDWVGSKPSIYSCRRASSLNLPHDRNISLIWPLVVVVNRVVITRRHQKITNSAECAVHC